MSTVNVDEKLGVNKFHVDEGNAHIVLKDSPDLAEYHKLFLACPAGLYKIDDSGVLRFDYAGCLECGTCRVLCGKTILDKWEFPNGGMGIEFRYG
ncbi:MAG: ferredoxin family protein [Gracilibacteraceae bacterium]|jgi:ferredoxin-like protein FixX|nr:ferredoxin family protein [Gracilibacteraceae bacterium]